MNRNQIKKFRRNYVASAIVKMQVFFVLPLEYKKY